MGESSGQSCFYRTSACSLLFLPPAFDIGGTVVSIVSGLEDGVVKGNSQSDQGFSNVALLGSKPPHPRLLKSVLPVGRGRAQPATRSFPLFWGGEGKRKKTVEKP